MPQRQQNIDATISSLSQEENPSWKDLGVLLGRIATESYCENRGVSFTQWVSDHAADFRLKESSLWRYHATVEYYVGLRQRLTPSGLTLPFLEALPENVSPENLELLSKLERVVPESIFMDLAQRVVSASITRSKLREIWQAYRPAMSGKTARGACGEPPRVDLNDSEQAQAVERAGIFTALSASGSQWTGIDAPSIYSLFMSVSTVRGKEGKSFEFDAIAVVQNEPESELLFHGIEFKNIVTARNKFQNDERINICDYFWLALPARAMRNSFSSIPDHIGILVEEQQLIRVLRPARQIQKIERNNSDLLARGLLMKLIRR